MEIIKNFDIETIKNSEISLEKVKDIFANSSKDILYITDDNNVYLGCITLGNILNTSNIKQLINFKSKNIYSSKTEKTEAIEIFSAYRSIKNIPVINKDRKLIYEYQKVMDISHILKVIEHVEKQGAKIFFTYIDTEKASKKCLDFGRDKYIFSNILKNIDEFEPFLKSIYGERYKKGYFEKVTNIPPVIKRPSGEIVHQDTISKYINVVNGTRITLESTGNYNIKIAFVGACRVFGYAVEDKDTVSSYMQELFNKIFGKNKIKVQNRGIWGIPEEELYDNVLKSHFDENEIVIMDLRKPIKGANIINLTDAFCEHKLKNEFYFERITHCNHQINKIQAEIIVNSLKSEIEKRLEKKQYTLKNKVDIENHCLDKYEKDIKSYINKVYEKYNLEKAVLFNQTVGSVIVNCNPFTNGHRYLIETAAKCVDSLIVFVVEENRSFFPFNDRYELVKQGINDIKNIFIIPSGNFMASTLTFPGYFIRDMPEAVEFDMSKDVFIFGKYIAPEFNITKRFLGQEPFDKVTKQYNQQLKEILPEYNIDVIIFPRKKENNEFISASIVRKYIKTKEWEKIKNLVPDSTFNYLKNKF